MNGRKQSKSKSALSFVLIFLVIVLAVGLVFRFTNAGDKIKDLTNLAFRVEYNGENYTGQDNMILLPTQGQVQFKVKGAESYKVKITPNVTEETNFTYNVGDDVYSFSQADISKVFLTGNYIQNGNLILTCSESYALESVLSKLHGGAEITLNGSLEYPYLLTFTDGDGKTITFALGQFLTVTLSPDHIVF